MLPKSKMHYHHPENVAMRAKRVENNEAEKDRQRMEAAKEYLKNWVPDSNLFKREFKGK